MRVIDGSIIARYIDENGWTPQDGQTAYAENWFGIPFVNLSTDQLVYRPKSPRASELYGLSATETAAPIIEVGMKRLEMWDLFYTQGSIPDMMQVIPPGTTPKQVEDQQNWMNSVMAGNIARKLQLRLVQSFCTNPKDEQFIQSKEKMLTDSLDDLIVRCLCFCYGISQQRLLKMMGTGKQAETSQEASEDEGLQPDQDYLVATMNYIIQDRLGYDDYEFSFRDERERDILKQAQTDTLYVKTGINTINEIRRNKGDDPSTNPAADTLMVETANGFVELGQTTSMLNATINGDGTPPSQQPPGAPKPGEHGHQPALAAEIAANKPEPEPTAVVPGKKPAVAAKPAAKPAPKKKAAKCESCACGVPLVAPGKHGNLGGDVYDCDALAFNWNDFHLVETHETPGGHQSRV